MKNKNLVSILILTHNAPKYVSLTLKSLKKHTKNVNYEVLVLDNASRFHTKILLWFLYKFQKLADCVVFSSRNTLFAAGNNILASVANRESKYFLLLNSDVEVRNESWLKNLIELHKKNRATITSYGVVDNEPYRIDGYCYLIDAQKYRENPLDENFQWWWAITKQQADIMVAGGGVQGVKNHEKYLHHFGGKSGKDFKNAKGMDMSAEIAKKWFKSKKPEFI